MTASSGFFGIIWVGKYMDQLVRKVIAIACGVNTMAGRAI
jgi:hypothetical protein